MRVPHGFWAVSTQGGKDDRYKAVARFGAMALIAGDLELFAVLQLRQHRLPCTGMRLSGLVEVGHVDIEGALVNYGVDVGVWDVAVHRWRSVQRWIGLVAMCTRAA